MCAVFRIARLHTRDREGRFLGEVEHGFHATRRLFDRPKSLDALGPAMLSLTGSGDRLRMHCLLAYVNVKPTLRGASFTWEGDRERERTPSQGR